MPAQKQIHYRHQQEIENFLLENGIAAAATKLNVDSLAELRSKNVPPTDDSYKYNYEATHDSADGDYSFEFCEAKILAILGEAGTLVENVVEGDECSLILDRTCFYAEQGGQIYDQGYVTVESNDGVTTTIFRVQKTILQKDGYILHCGAMVGGAFRVGDSVALSFDVRRRRLTMNNHTSVHILDHALVETFGSEYCVKGSLVTPDRMQLDFSGKVPMTAEQIRKVEDMVVDVIKRNVPVYTMYCKQEEARKIVGLITLPNVDYPDPARVVSIGEPIDALIENPQSEASLRTSVDFCGGTHVHRTGHIQDFVIVSEESLSKGFRRIVALSGPGVEKANREVEKLKLRAERFMALANGPDDVRYVRRDWTVLSQTVSTSAIPYHAKEEIKNTLNEIKKIIDAKEKTTKLAQSMSVVKQAESLIEKYSSSAKFMVESLDADSNKEAIDAALKRVRCLDKILSVMFLSADEGAEKIFAMCTVTPEAIDKGLTADKWIKSVTTAMNGKGGGNPKWAQASGSNYTNLSEVIIEARRFAMKYVNDRPEDYESVINGSN